MPLFHLNGLGKFKISRVYLWPVGKGHNNTGCQALGNLKLRPFQTPARVLYTDSFKFSIVIEYPPSVLPLWVELDKHYIRSAHNLNAGFTLAFQHPKWSESYLRVFLLRLALVSTDLLRESQSTVWKRILTVSVWLKSEDVFDRCITSIWRKVCKGCPISVLDFKVVIRAAPNLLVTYSTGGRPLRLYVKVCEVNPDEVALGIFDCFSLVKIAGILLWVVGEGQNSTSWQNLVHRINLGPVQVPVKAIWLVWGRSPRQNKKMMEQRNKNIQEKINLPKKSHPTRYQCWYVVYRYTLLCPKELSWFNES